MPEARPEHEPYTKTLEIVLSRSWTCAACGRQLRKGARARVEITAGHGRNRVTHLDSANERATQRQGGADDGRCARSLP